MPLAKDNRNISLLIGVSLIWGRGLRCRSCRSAFCYRLVPFGIPRNQDGNDRGCPGHSFRVRVVRATASRWTPKPPARTQTSGRMDVIRTKSQYCGYPRAGNEAGRDGPHDVNLGSTAAASGARPSEIRKIQDTRDAGSFQASATIAFRPQWAAPKVRRCSYAPQAVAARYGNSIYWAIVVLPTMRSMQQL